MLGHGMAFGDVGDGEPIVFLHGNPTSSFLWRNVIPHVQELGWCIAPDLIGMGDSDKLDPGDSDRYRFVEHRRYLDALLAALGITENVTLVAHDWGGALAFDWANRHRSAVKGICYMETIVRPLSWDEWPPEARSIFEALRGPDGDDMIINRNVFVDRILPASIQRKLSRGEMRAYKAPFKRVGEDRRPTLTWPRELPIDGRPADVHAIVEQYGEWLAHSEVPKLFVNGEPGSILVGAQREFCRAWPNQTEVTVAGIHFLQEDSPDDIGRAIAAWYRSL